LRSPIRAPEAQEINMPVDQPPFWRGVLQAALPIVGALVAYLVITLVAS